MSPRLLFWSRTATLSLVITAMMVSCSQNHSDDANGETPLNSALGDTTGTRTVTSTDVSTNTATNTATSTSVTTSTNLATNTATSITTSTATIPKWLRIIQITGLAFNFVYDPTKNSVLPTAMSFTPSFLIHLADIFSSSLSASMKQMSSPEQHQVLENLKALSSLYQTTKGDGSKISASWSKLNAQQKSTLNQLFSHDSNAIDEALDVVPEGKIKAFVKNVSVHVQNQ